MIASEAVEPFRGIVAWLDLVRPLVFLDVESTGLNPETDRIVELAAVKLFPDGNVTSFERRFNPGIPISPDATAIHGITDADVSTAGPFRDMAPNLRLSLTNVDLAAYNGRRFDVPILAAEFKRAGFDWGPGAAGWDAQIVDPLAIWIQKERRDLAGAVERFAPDQAGEIAGHSAAGDVLAVIAVLAGQRATFWPDAPGAAVRRFSIGDLVDAGRDPAWIDPDGKLAWKGDVPVVTFGKHAGTPVKDLPRSYVDWLMTTDFPQAVKSTIISIRKGTLPQKA